MRKQKIKPSKEMSKFSFFIGIIFSIFGIFIIVGAILTPVSIIAVPFALIWTSIAVFNTYRAYKNEFTDKGIPYYEIESTSNDAENPLDFEEKLRKIDRLKREGLISEDEYNRKREEILNDKW